MVDYFRSLSIKVMHQSAKLNNIGSIPIVALCELSFIDRINV